MAKEIRQKSSAGSALDFEAQLWAAADKMRGHMDASESAKLEKAIRANLKRLGHGR